ncbi:MAG: nitroreductase family protein [Clostridia bacterium]|nr:nitroreductase family protein [Clostridia bacterium]
MIKELLLKTRSYRRYDENIALTDADVEAIAEAVRFVPSAGNLQRIRIAFVNETLQNAEVFETLGFAAYLKDWRGPSAGERPVGYAVLMTEGEPDTNLAIDIGIAAEAMLLTAMERGIGGCIFRSFKRERLSEILNRDGLTPVLVISFGRPAEQVVIEDIKDGNVKYYRDDGGVHHVPKRTLDDILV